MKRTLFFSSLLFLALSISRGSTIVSKSEAAASLDLDAIGAAFAWAGTPEEFEDIINDTTYRLNNLDLNFDGVVDYLRVVERVDGNVHSFVIQSVLAPDEYEDVAEIVVEVSEADAPAAVSSDAVSSCVSDAASSTDTSVDVNYTVKVVGAPQIYGTDYCITPVYVERPLIVTNIVRVAYVPWVSPWHWGYFPTRYVCRPPVVYASYRAGIERALAIRRPSVRAAIRSSIHPSVRPSARPVNHSAHVNNSHGKPAGASHSGHTGTNYRYGHRTSAGRPLPGHTSGTAMRPSTATIRPSVAPTRPSTTPTRPSTAPTRPSASHVSGTAARPSGTVAGRPSTASSTAGRTSTAHINRSTSGSVNRSQSGITRQSGIAVRPSTASSHGAKPSASTSRSSYGTSPRGNSSSSRSTSGYGSTRSGSHSGSSYSSSRSGSGRSYGSGSRSGSYGGGTRGGSRAGSVRR